MDIDAKRVAAEKWLADHDLTPAWLVYLAFGSKPNLPFAEKTIVDIVHKVVLYGGVSEKAAEYAKSLVERLKEKKDAPPVPAGKMEVTGEVISVKLKDTNYGPKLKMLVKSAAGWKVWGSVPAALTLVPGENGPREIAKGDKVRFLATLEPSKDDAGFGFFSRPTKGEFLAA